MAAAAEQPTGTNQVPTRYLTVDQLIGMRWDDYLAAICADLDTQLEQAHQDGIRALRLAPTLDVYRALIAGERVPKDRLDPVWAKRYGIR